ncbi:1066_t:CDS:1, partial [Gigaspora margarita]
LKYNDIIKEFREKKTKAHPYKVNITYSRAAQYQQSITEEKDETIRS